jgi:flagellar biosynthesis/type III secretory pathway protein FliH
MATPLAPDSIGLAGLLTSLRPRVLPSEAPVAPPDLDAIRQAGWEAGFVAGEAAATAGLAPLREQLASAAAALDAACCINADDLRPLFTTLVHDTAGAVLQAELTVGGSLLAPLVDAALAAVRLGEAPVLSAHPDTLAALQAYLPDVATAADATCSRDGFSVSAPQFTIAASLADRLTDIVAGLA